MGCQTLGSEPLVTPASTTSSSPSSEISRTSLSLSSSPLGGNPYSHGSLRFSPDVGGGGGGGRGGAGEGGGGGGDGGGGGPQPRPIGQSFTVEALGRAPVALVWLAEAAVGAAVPPLSC